MKSFPQHTFVLSDGRQLAFHLYGLPTGKPVYIFHGFPGSRIQAALIKTARCAVGQRMWKHWLITWGINNLR